MPAATPSAGPPMNSQLAQLHRERVARLARAAPAGPAGESPAPTKPAMKRQIIDLTGGSDDDDDVRIIAVRPAKLARRAPPAPAVSPARLLRPPLATHPFLAPRSTLFAPPGPKSALRVATSGFSFMWWHRSFYPRKLQKGAEFEHYLKTFSSAEAVRCRDGREVRIAVKVNNYFTHKKKMHADADFCNAFAGFFSGAALLGPHLGPLLFQLPHFFHYSRTRLEDICRAATMLEHMGLGGRMAVEQRNPSWWRDDVYSAFAAHGICLVHIHVANDPLRPWMPTFPAGPAWQPPSRPITSTSLVYLRLHGPQGRYVGSYGTAFLKETALWVKERAGGREVWAAFNNTDSGRGWPDACADARQLAGEAGVRA
ncbi:hypothetical protein DFJ74DRAFT_771102 [Hyaloraphidium curvatum]|nr:hypothetical protein DFJ74DRAFT_771102 [Hyaloraphidium curvatum]